MKLGLQRCTVPSLLRKGKRDEAEVVVMMIIKEKQHRSLSFGEGEGG
ncbi:MAG: hypothetical protein ACXWV6_15865 [Chitinophagaceae bacterium]